VPWGRSRSTGGKMRERRMPPTALGPAPLVSAPGSTRRYMLQSRLKAQWRSTFDATRSCCNSR
jgi:hypothetical protein